MSNSRRIDDLRLNLTPHDTARLIDFFNRHQHNIAQRHFADRHRTAQGM
jgi:hypothetical protein